MEEFRTRPVLKELSKNTFSGGRTIPTSSSLNSISCNQSGVNRNKLANSNARQSNLIINDRLVIVIKPIKSRFQEMY